MVPGIVVVWSGGRPRLAAHRIPEAGVALGRALIPDEPAGAVGVVDLGPIPNGIGAGRPLVIRPEGNARIVLDGNRLTTTEVLSGPNLPAIVAFGRSVIALVENVQPFENVTPRSESGLVIAGSLGPVFSAVDDAANAEDNLSLKGPDRIVHVLARRYAAKLGTHAWFRPGGDQHLEHFLATRPTVRTVIIELTRPLFEPDERAITALLETDLRLVLVRRDDHFIQWLPPALLTATIEVPTARFDEFAITIFDEASRRCPGATLDAISVAFLLDQSMRSTEESWLGFLTRALETWDGSPMRAGG